ncbi:S1C family serine protease [Clostridium ganghwense]|uniref:Trypsin-like peptidase domain-containing protein n=1 Tax=Clostridium ganghwense TaxID=312089 RepID=A0ABT4CPM6_9CLOT|nr:trypsin-like peptidase domain-containing protein [Clostridium ganghwense]MCY6371001.1 trypsin-like peptidase domain-containing protein [Clostridium ganghwense]
MSMFNNNDDFNKERKFIEGEIIETNSIQNEYIKTDSTTISKNNKRKGFGKRIMSYVLVGLLCASLGGTVSTIATIKYLNKTSSQEKTSQSENNINNNISKTSSNTVPLSVANIAKQVGPAVVGVSTKSIKSVDRFGFPEQQEGMGSGIIFNEDGYILTNYHVVAGARQINVIFNDGNSGKEIPAKLVNYNAEMDIAVIKLTQKVKVPAVAEFGDSDSLQVGDAAIAIGNPLGKEFLGTVTSGVISAVNREIAIDGQKHKYIQTDAAINPGNSGGALVNAYGQVIGVNSAKIGGSQVEGIGFAIPINAIKPEIEGLLKPILKIGIGVRDIDEKISKRYDIPVGIYVQQVEEFSPAEKAGLMPGDVITKFDGKKVKTVKELNELKQKHNVNDTVSIEIIRDGKKKALSLKLAE